jgi:hypothetical protein
MYKKLITSGVMALALMNLAGCSAKAQSADSKIKLTQFEITHPDKNSTKLVMAAEGTGVAVGSYFIRLDVAPVGMKIDSFYEYGGFYYVNGGTSDKPSANLMDNGKLDEDPTPGVFAYTFHTKNWPDGKYMFLAGAHNRPAAGTYMSDSRGFIITKGNVAPLAISNIPSAVHRDVYNKEGVYAVFPDLFILPDGKIGTSFGTKAVRSHIAQSASASLISADGGKTWQNADEPLSDKRWKTKDGGLVVPEARGWIYTDTSHKDELAKQHKIINATPSGGIAYLGGAEFRTSSDGGKTWKTQDIKVPENCVGLMNHHSYATYLVTKKGVRLRAIYGRRFDPKTNTVGKDEEFFLRSTDDGKSWTCYPMYPGGLPDPKIGFNETAIAEAADGAIVAMMRSDPMGYLWEATSKDGGLTWSAPVQTPIWGSPADLIRLKDGRLLCSYGYRRAPMGIRASLSSDNGKTWDVAHELILRQDGFGNPGDLGYPLAYQLPDGDIFTIYYITTDGQNTHVASTTYELPKP